MAAAVELRNRVTGLRYLHASNLLANPANWRTHPKVQRDALTGLLEEIGIAGALLAYETPAGLQLIDGHLRKDAAPDALWPVLVLDVDESEAATLLATIDPIAAMAGTDAGKLEALIAGVRTGSDAVNALIGDLAAGAGIDLYPGAAIEDVPPAIDRAEELRQQYGTEMGQLWALGDHRLLCGDSTDAACVARLFGADRFRVMWTDPPYGVNHSGGSKDPRARTYRRGDKLDNDDLPEEETESFARAAFALAAQYGTAGASCYVAAPAVPLHRRFIDALDSSGFKYRHQLIWVKNTFVFGRSDYHYRHEPILYGWKDDGAHYITDDRTNSSVFEVDRPQHSEFHPTTKPVELIRPMIENSSKRGEIVYEPFSGSGSTILASEQCGRHCYAIELDPGYVAVALHRWEAATGRTAHRLD